MTRNEIEKIADEFGIENNCLRVSTALASMMIHQINLVLEQAAQEIETQTGYWPPNTIRALKIK